MRCCRPPCCKPPPPTWRLCHPVNIYVFKNGCGHEKPQLIHIPMEKKKNMTTVLDAIGSRMKMTVGYPIALYNMDGEIICKPYEIEPYRYYVVTTNLDRRFRCVDYGNMRDPLVVIGHDSKHVNTLRHQNKRYDLFCLRGKRKLHEVMPHGEKNGLGPTELPALGKPCGTLCTKVPQTYAAKPTQVCSDEIMCVDRGCDPCDSQPQPCRGFREQQMAQLIQRMQRQNNQAPSGGARNNGELMDLIMRYQHVGSDIFKMFQNKINEDNTQSGMESKWNLSDKTGQEQSMYRIQEELKRLAAASCQFAFDKGGNFMGSPGCAVPRLSQGQASPYGNQDNCFPKPEVYTQESTVDSYVSNQNDQIPFQQQPNEHDHQHQQNENNGQQRLSASSQKSQKYNANLPFQEQPNENFVYTANTVQRASISSQKSHKSQNANDNLPFQQKSNENVHQDPNNVQRSSFSSQKSHKSQNANENLPFQQKSNENLQQDPNNVQRSSFSSQKSHKSQNANENLPFQQKSNENIHQNPNNVQRASIGSHKSQNKSNENVQQGAAGNGHRSSVNSQHQHQPSGNF